MEDITYDSKPSVEKINAEVDRLWEELQEGGALRAAAEAHGIDVDQLTGQQRTDVLNFEDEGAGIDPGTVAIVVAFTPLFVKIGSDLWEHIFLPRIIERWSLEAMKRRDR